MSFNSSLTNADQGKKPPRRKPPPDLVLETPVEYQGNSSYPTYLVFQSSPIPQIPQNQVPPRPIPTNHQSSFPFSNYHTPSNTSLDTQLPAYSTSPQLPSTPGQRVSYSPQHSSAPQVPIITSYSTVNTGTGATSTTSYSSIPQIPSLRTYSVPEILPVHPRPSQSSIAQHIRNISISGQNLSNTDAINGEDGNTHDEYDDFNDSMISNESPKPMGPKEFFEYDLPIVTTSRDQYKKRHFQHLSRTKSQETRERESQSSLPYPENEIDLDYLGEQESQDQSFITNEISIRQSPTLNHSTTTPSKIPELHTSNSLTHPRLRKLLSAYESDRDSFNSSSSPSPSPSPSSSPTRRREQLIRNNTVGGISASPRSTSPSRAYTLRLPTQHSPTNSYLESISMQRTPSPTKSYGRSPTTSSPFVTDADLSWQQNISEGYENDLTRNDSFDFEYNEDSSRFNSTESGNYNNYSFLNQDIQAQTPSYIDLSYLPDLPSMSESSKRSSLGSLSKMQSRSSMSSNLSLNFPSVSRKRKEEALPPVPLDLPQLPFSSASLVSQHFSTCEAIWLLSSVFQWCLRLRIWLHDLFISQKEFKKALVKLFIYHRRDLTLDVINNNADQAIDDLFKGGAIKLDVRDNHTHDEDSEIDSELPKLPRKTLENKNEPGIVMNENIYISGVLTDLTACYYYGTNHTSKEIKLRCYSPRCHLNRMIDYEMEWKTMKIEEIVLGEDWVTHWKLTAIELKALDPSTVSLQSFIFDLLRYEQTFIQRAKCYIEVVGPMFIKAAKRLAPGEIVSLSTFEDSLLQPGKSLLEIHQKILFEPLLRILMKDGRYVKNLVGIATIYHAWSQEVKNSLLKYMSTVPMIESLLDVPILKAWVDREVSTVKRVNDLKVNGHLLLISTFNSRYQSLPLQILEIRKRYDTQEPEYISLTQTLDAIKRLGSKVNQMKVYADNMFELKKIQKQLAWKSTISPPSLNLGSENRRFLFRGDLTRKGDLKINTTNNHIILLDNYFLLTEVKTKVSPVVYKVVENPIPIELIIVEEKDTGVETKTLNSTPVEVAGVNPPEDADFAFKVRYAGRGKHDAFTFFTKTKEERSDWIGRITKARSNVCERYKNNVPYTVDLISSTCFAYEINNRVVKLPICAPHDPVYDASMEALKKLKGMGFTNDLYNFPGAKNHIVNSKVQSFCKFEYRGNTFHLVGVSSGLYCCDTKNRWKKLINGDVGQMSVETDISLLIVLGNKQLRYYPLDLILNVYFERRKNVTCVSISNEPVAFYSIGLHRDQKMLFYAKRKGNTSTTTNFKVLTSQTDNDGVFSAFAVYKKFYVEAECFGVSVFNTSFAVHTSKGFETLTLDKLQPMSIPEFPHLENKKVDGYRKLQTNNSQLTIEQIRKTIQSTSTKPMGMFKLRNNAEFLLVYSDCAIFTNKHGKLSRFSCLRFDFKAKSIAFDNNHLFIICEEAIEVWAISNDVKGPTRLVQTIVGKDISLISTETLSIAMANPLVLGLQLVFLLQLRANN